MIVVGRILRPRALVVAAILGVTVCGCDNVPRSADLTWTEPVQLASGETVKIKRHVMMWHERALGGGFSSAPVYKTSSIELEPASISFPKWDAPLVPLVIDKDPGNGEWVIVASIDGCSMWLRNGLPRPPYWTFRLRSGEWYRDVLPDGFLNRRTNLFVEADVTDTSSELNRNIGERKLKQIAAPKHAKQYGKIDSAFEKRCGGQAQASQPVGHEELDLQKFRSLP